MIASALFAAWTTSLAAAGEASEILENRSFYAMAWQCDGEGCESRPRHLGPNLRFSLPDSQEGFARAKKLDKAWSMTLDCSIVRDRLAKCEAADDTSGSVEARTTAVGLASSFRLQPENAAKKSSSSHAIVLIQYETGDCPSWMCTITPPPPPPPPRKVLTDR